MNDTAPETNRDLPEALADSLVRFARINMKTAWTLMPKSQFHVLHFIDEAPKDEAGGVSVATIAENSPASRPRLSRVLGDLEHQGYITRQTSPRDRRATLVFLTDKGRTYHDEALALRDEFFDEVTRTYGAEETAKFAVQLDAFADALSSSLETLEKHHPELIAEANTHTAHRCGCPKGRR